MAYIPLTNEEEIKLANSTLSTQLMMGVYPSQKYINKVKKKYPTPDGFELPNKILQQDKNLLAASNVNFEKNQELNSRMDDAIMKVGNHINLFEITFSNNAENPKMKDLDTKVDEFKRETENNDEKVKKINDTIPEYLRKKKENEDFFKKYVGEKKVWLDRLKEDKIKEETYKGGFKYLYEAKAIKLLMEGVLLEKVQDMIEKELYKRGELFGWKIMNIEKVEENRKEEDFQFNRGLMKLVSSEAILQEREHKEKIEREDDQLQRNREEIMKVWKKIWSEIWVPEVVPSVDPDIKTKRDFIIKITMDVTFDLFKKVFFDIYKLKNIILSTDEYIIMDKVRNYFPEKISQGRSQDEIALNQLMNIIESIKAEEEIIYCDLKPAKQKIEEYKKNTGNTEAIQRLELIVSKIEEVQNIVNTREYGFVKKEVEDIRKLINAIPYESEKKLFLDNLVNSSRLYDTFLPITNILMVITFMTVGKKRDKNYDSKIEEAKSEILKLKGKNNEITGKWNLLKEIKEKLGEDEANDIMEQSQEIQETEAYKTQKILSEARNSLNRIIELKNQQQMSTFNFYKKIRKAIVRPKDLC
jgi:hypothetical protein